MHSLISKKKDGRSYAILKQCISTETFAMSRLILLITSHAGTMKRTRSIYTVRMMRTRVFIRRAFVHICSIPLPIVLFALIYRGYLHSVSHCPCSLHCKRTRKIETYRCTSRYSDNYSSRLCCIRSLSRNSVHRH